jgi:hypothetical protein
MLMTGSGQIDAERAFTSVTRARRRAALGRVLRRQPPVCGRLPVYDGHALRTGVPRPRGGLSEIPIDAIRGTLEPSKADVFDRHFRPTPRARRRWQQLWLAEQRGAPLPPIEVVAVEDGYAVADGHHRVSIANARGAATIDAVVQRGLSSR